jgi:hypothetical protein
VDGRSITSPKAMSCHAVGLLRRGGRVEQGPAPDYLQHPLVRRIVEAILPLRCTKKRPLNRQTGDPCRRGSLGVEQPIPKIFVRLTPLPQVFRHAVRCSPSIATRIRRSKSRWQVLVEAGTCASRFFAPLLPAALLTRSPRDRFGCPLPGPRRSPRYIFSTGNTRLEIPRYCLGSG